MCAAATAAIIAGGYSYPLTRPSVRPFNSPKSRDRSGLSAATQKVLEYTL